MFMIKEGSLALLTLAVAVTAGLGISRMVDTPAPWSAGHVVIHPQDGQGSDRPATPSVRLVGKSRAE